MSTTMGLARRLEEGLGVNNLYFESRSPHPTPSCIIPRYDSVPVPFVVLAFTLLSPNHPGTRFWSHTCADTTRMTSGSPVICGAVACMCRSVVIN